MLFLLEKGPASTWMERASERHEAQQDKARQPRNGSAMGRKEGLIPTRTDEPRPQDTEQRTRIPRRHADATWGGNPRERRQMSGCQGPERQVTAPKSGAPCGHENILELDGDKGCTHCDYTK